MRRLDRRAVVPALLLAATLGLAGCNDSDGAPEFETNNPSDNGSPSAAISSPVESPSPSDSASDLGSPSAGGTDMASPSGTSTP